jgi:3-oxoacyl-[acyl-carrier protein] reductase
MPGKVIVTGAGRGIGYAIAEKFLASGAHVSICASSQKSADCAKESLLKAAPGGKVFAMGADVSKWQDCELFVSEAVKEMGGVDVLVNNAGITKDNLVIRMSEEDFSAVIDVNLKGTFLMSKAVLKIMMKARSGSVINISSVVGESGNAGQANYSASKAGVIGLTKSMAKEFASRNIRVNAIAPGFVKTDMTDALNEETKAAVLQSVPLKRFAEVADIAAAVMFLASNDAGYITGQVLGINGGLYI